MIRRQLRIYVSLLAVFLLCGFIAQAAAGDNHQLTSTVGKNMANKRPSGQFSVSGTFSGELNGYITVGGEKVFISKTTALRIVGAGKIERGTHLRNVFLYASGSVRRGVPTASLILVRSNSNLGERAMLRSNKDSKYVIPSRNNPKVGELKENTPE
jgi:hypothetical protein